MSITRWIALSLIFSSIGCVAFQDCEYRSAQRYRAHCAWWCGCDEPCSCNPWSHYSYGWRRGYSDVLLGGNGECPPVPPQCYWSHKYQNHLGECAIENWFSGYSDGAAAAIASCRNRYNAVPRSNMFRQCEPSCLSYDYSPYDFGRTILGLKFLGRSRVEDAYDPEDGPADSPADMPADMPAETPTVPVSPNPPEDGEMDSDLSLDEEPSASNSAPVNDELLNIPVEEELIPPPPSDSNKKTTGVSPGKWMKPASLKSGWRPGSMLGKLNLSSN